MLVGWLLAGLLHIPTTCKCISGTDLLRHLFFSRAEDPGFDSRLTRGIFLGRVIPVASKLALQWLPCQAHGYIGSALGLVGPVSVYCDWVR